MPVFDVDSVAGVKSYATSGVEIRDLSQIQNWNRVILCGHAIFLKHQPMKASITVDSAKWGSSYWEGGSVGFLPGGAQFQCEVTPYAGTVLIFNPTMIAEVAPEVDFRGADVRASRIISDRVYPLARSFTDLVANGVIDDYPLLAGSMKVSLLTEMMSRSSPWAERSIAAMASGLTARRLQRVIDFIEANLHEPFTLGALSEIAALSQFHFCRSFKKAMGVPPAKYVLQRRMSRAKVLLLGDLPVVDVSLQCGFSTQSHFSMAFKAETGLTPRAYRKSYTGR